MAAAVARLAASIFVSGAPIDPEQSTMTTSAASSAGPGAAAPVARTATRACTSAAPTARNSWGYTRIWNVTWLSSQGGHRADRVGPVDQPVRVGAGVVPGEVTVRGLQRQPDAPLVERAAQQVDAGVGRQAPVQDEAQGRLQQLDRQRGPGRPLVGGQRVDD